MNTIKIFSVFINDVMFHSFFNLNPNLWPYFVDGIDNRASNFGLPIIYNRIIESNIDSNSWLFFVHEDFYIKSSIDHILDLDPRCIYGTFGVRLENDIPIAYGAHTCSNKDGSNAVKVGLPVDLPTRVDSIDCQSILIHTSLLRDFHALRFDNNLSFDLYAEEFCMNAFFRHNIEIKVFNLDFQHYSHGNITDRYHKGLAYLAERYPDYAVPGSCSFIGGRSSELERKFQYNISASRPLKN